LYGFVGLFYGFHAAGRRQSGHKRITRANLGLSGRVARP
jgi:hypothetical protein